ncbi:MAG: signal recognition particle-docking protein FtsY, partial [Armatimonadetes bacterium]|nr:signal recognition particle-docking protein FtsY [Armatimonadota bacterium]
MLKGLFRRVGAVLAARAVVNDELLDELEAALIQADVSVPVAEEMVERLREAAESHHITEPSALLELLAQHVEEMLAPCEAPLNGGEQAPTVLLMLGVNGVGKTTCIAKIAHWYQSAGNKVLLVAADTFRAAAAEQLSVWAERVGCDIVQQQHGSDPAAVVYDGLEAARARGHNLVIIDTAGRLHTKRNLMEELRKMDRVIQGQLGRPADERLLVIDATTGQNAIRQAEQFNEALDITGLMIAKLDGTAKGGVVLSISQQLELPIKLIGIGERLEDLRLFSAHDFAG